MTLFSQTHATCNCNNISLICFLITLCLSSLLCYEYTFFCVLKKRRSSYLHFTVTWNLMCTGARCFRDERTLDIKWHMAIDICHTLKAPYDNFFLAKVPLYSVCCLYQANLHWEGLGVFVASSTSKSRQGFTASYYDHEHCRTGLGFVGRATPFQKVNMLIAQTQQLISDLCQSGKSQLTD